MPEEMMKPKNECQRGRETLSKTWWEGRDERNRDGPRKIQMMWKRDSD